MENIAYPKYLIGMFEEGDSCRTLGVYRDWNSFKDGYVSFKSQIIDEATKSNIFPAELSYFFQPSSDRGVTYVGVRVRVKILSQLLLDD